MTPPGHDEDFDVVLGDGPDHELARYPEIRRPADAIGLIEAIGHAVDAVLRASYQPIPNRASLARRWPVVAELSPWGEHFPADSLDEVSRRLVEYGYKVAPTLGGPA